MYSPRISGKSFALGQMVYIYSNKYPNHDIVVTRANYNSLEDSLYNEILAFADDIGQSDYYTALRSPLKSKRYTATQFTSKAWAEAITAAVKVLKTVTTR